MECYHRRIKAPLVAGDLGVVLGQEASVQDPEVGRIKVLLAAEDPKVGPGLEANGKYNYLFIEVLCNYYYYS